MFSFDESKYISDFKMFTKAPDESGETLVADDVDVDKNGTVAESTRAQSWRNLTTKGFELGTLKRSEPARKKHFLISEVIASPQEKLRPEHSGGRQ